MASFHYDAFEIDDSRRLRRRRVTVRLWTSRRGFSKPRACARGTRAGILAGACRGGRRRRASRGGREALPCAAKDAHVVEMEAAEREWKEATAVTGRRRFSIHPT